MTEAYLEEMIGRDELDKILAGAQGPAPAVEDPDHLDAQTANENALAFKQLMVVPH